MRKMITMGALVLFGLGAFAQEEQERVLVVKPVLTTRMDTPTEWGGLAAKASQDPKYVMEKVEGVEDSLYTCKITLDKYYKTNKWASKWGETVGFVENADGELVPNEGWSNNYKFVSVWRDDYGDQENKNNPNAISGALNFVNEIDGQEVIFYALVKNGKIHSYCDAMIPTMSIANNAAGGLTFSAALGKTFFRNAIEIAGSGKIEMQTNKHLINPQGRDGAAKYAIYSRGRHAITIDMLTFRYSIDKVLDELTDPWIAVGENELAGKLGAFKTTESILLAAGLKGSINTAADAKLNMDSTKAYLAYEIIPADEENGEVNRIALTTGATGNVTSVTWNDEEIAIPLSELAAGTYTLKAWLETVSLGDVLVADNEGAGYTATFTVEAGETVGFHTPTLQADISTVAQTIQATFEGAADVRLYSVSGQLLDEQLVNGTYTKTVHPGIYVLSVAEKAYKVVVK